MKTLSAPPAIEPLEARIAPATIVLQAGQTGQFVGEIDYTDADGAGEDAVFVNTEANPADPISALVGPGAAGVADTFYAKLSTGSLLKIFSNAGFQPLISGDVVGDAGISGNIVGFFVDKNLDNEVQLNELTGLSLGNNVVAIVSGDVDGDVLTNFNDALMKIGGAAEPLGQGQDLLSNAVKSLVISGNVNGSIISGGQVNKLRVGGSVEQILAGTAANGYAYDFNGAAADGGDTLVVNAAVGAKGVAILNTTVGELNRLQAGDGGAGGVGGAIANITVIADENGMQILAGNGGAGTAAKISGGVGGAATKVIVQGLESGAVDETANALIEIRSGDGGDAFAGSAGKGGAAGLLSSVYVGFQEVAGTTLPQRSLTPLNDAVLVQGGVGGDGKTGGAGGGIKTVSLFGAPIGAGNDLTVRGGDGGATNLANIASKAGAGGSVSLVTVFNPSTVAAAHDAKIVVEGGDGGSAAVGGSGNAGGSVSTTNLVGYRLEVRAGNGSDGQKAGGLGGSLLSITANESADGVRPENVLLDAGRGGAGTAGIGGKGGNVSKVTLNNADLQLLTINQTVGAGDGGTSSIGAGAAGGLVSGVDVAEFDAGVAGQAFISSGSGGQGGNGSPAGGNGGAAGAISLVTVRGVQLDLTTAAGDGGDATLKGAGGVGGAITGLSFFSQKQQGGAEVNATVTAGSGGDGLSAAGGAGGLIKTVNVSLGNSMRTLVGNTETAIVDGGAIMVTGGTGGSSNTANGGVGGAITDSTFLTYGGSVTAAAGSAGAGFKASIGGRLQNLAIDNGTTATLSSGNGSGGGAGGDIRGVGVSRAEERFPVVGTITADAGGAPLGSVSVIAGNGSGAGTAAGVGGSIVDFSGFVGLTGSTTVQAGNGGAVAAKSANGGNVSAVTLFGGGGAGVEVKIRAGDALASSAKTGGIGGSVLGVDIGVNSYDNVDPANPDNSFALDPGTIIRHIAAGNGGDTNLATGKGGKGGDIKNVNTQHDIGVRSGQGFGFDTMGGLFVGAGGANTTVVADPKVLASTDGAAGSVQQVTADAIASIVAGRPNNGDIFTIRNLATKVDDVILNGLTNPTTVDANGTYTNFAVANLVGGVVDPNAPGAPFPAAHPHANTFDLVNGEFVDNDASGEFSLGDQITAKTDGFLAAITFINTVNNFRPEAVITSIAGVVTFIDDTNGQPTV